MRKDSDHGQDLLPFRDVPAQASSPPACNQAFRFALTAAVHACAARAAHAAAPPAGLRVQGCSLLSATDVGAAAQTLTFFKRSMLWIWGISLVVLFAPFMWGAALEQATGIWCAPCFATDA